MIKCLSYQFDNRIVWNWIHSIGLFDSLRSKWKKREKLQKIIQFFMHIKFDSNLQFFFHLYSFCFVPSTWYTSNKLCWIPRFVASHLVGNGRWVRKTTNSLIIAFLGMFSCLRGDLRRFLCHRNQIGLLLNLTNETFNWMKRIDKTTGNKENWNEQKCKNSEKKYSVLRSSPSAVSSMY